MPTAKNLNELFKMIQDKANSVLKNEIAQEAVETMKKHVNDDVYSVFTPSIYERTGGLLRDIDVEVVDDNTISIENTRSEDGKDIAQTIETGQGYDWQFEYNGVPRPFTANTYEELKNSGKLKQKMKDGLKKRDIDVR